MRVVIVEDQNEHSDKLITELRESRSVRTIAHLHRASSAVEMLQDAEQLDLDRTLIVLDLVLSNNESGFELLRYLHTRVQAPKELPVIVWTQFGDEVTQTICGYFRVPGFISKKAGENLNVAAVRSAVESYRAQRFGSIN